MIEKIAPQQLLRCLKPIFSENCSKMGDFGKNEDIGEKMRRRFDRKRLFPVNNCVYMRTAQTSVSIH